MVFIWIKKQFSSGHKNRFFLIQVVCILILFLSLYIPRYMQEYAMRQKMLSSSGNSEIDVSFILRERPDLEKGRYTIDTGKYILQVPQKLISSSNSMTLQTGKRYQARGIVVSTQNADLKLLKTYKISLLVQAISVIDCNEVSVKCVVDAFFSRMLLVKEGYVATVYRLFPTPHADLILGIVAGRKPGKDTKLYQDLQSLGLLHLLVASGANIASVVVVFHNFIKYFTTKKTVIILTIFWVLLYVYFVGGDPSLVRAFWFYLFSCIGILAGRPLQPLYTLSMVAGIMLIDQPFLLYSLSFQLSFAAVLGLFIVFPHFYTRGNSEENADWKEKIHTILVENTVAAISTTIFTLPITLSSFGIFPLISLPANVAVAWLIPFIFFSSLFLFLPIGWLVALPLWTITEVLVRLINLFSLFPHVSLHVIKWGFLESIGYSILMYCGVGKRLAKRMQER